MAETSRWKFINKSPGSPKKADIFFPHVSPQPACRHSESEVSALPPWPARHHAEPHSILPVAGRGRFYCYPISQMRRLSLWNDSNRGQIWILNTWYLYFSLYVPSWWCLWKYLEVTIQIQNLIISNTMRISNRRAVHMINIAKRNTTVFSLQICLWARNLVDQARLDRHRG